MVKTALITGITGQDGAYLAAHLLDLGYEVHGIWRRTSADNTRRLRSITGTGFARIVLHHGDLCDAGSITRTLAATRPDEIYNLGAMSHVKASFDFPEQTAEVDAVGVLRILEGVRSLGMEKKVRFYQASTSELFGPAGGAAQSEETPFRPRSPYGAAKLYAYWITSNYREAYGMFACNGILFNHESPIRGEDFVTRKITRGVAAICSGTASRIDLGNLDAGRDWGHARDFVEAMHLMLQAPEPEDFVIATGRMARVRDFAALAFSMVGVDIRFIGAGREECGVVSSVDTAFFWEKTGTEPPAGLSPGARVVGVDPAFFRPTDIADMRGDPSRACEKLGWRASTTLEEIVAEMMENDLHEAGFGRGARRDPWTAAARPPGPHARKTPRSGPENPLCENGPIEGTP